MALRVFAIVKRWLSSIWGLLPRRSKVQPESSAVIVFPIPRRATPLARLPSTRTPSRSFIKEPAAPRAPDWLDPWEYALAGCERRGILAFYEYRENKVFDDEQTFRPKRGRKASRFHHPEYYVLDEFDEGVSSSLLRELRNNGNIRSGLGYESPAIPNEFVARWPEPQTSPSSRPRKPPISAPKPASAPEDESTSYKSECLVELYHEIVEFVGTPMQCANEYGISINQVGMLWRCADRPLSWRHGWVSLKDLGAFEQRLRKSTDAQLPRLGGSTEGLPRLKMIWAPNKVVSTRIKD
jgi:hypothetical protein